ncbi:MAG: hypothetical protein E6Q97_36005 [Desulfurellales bacterium]|nr:MAG: hypothetical protein E6Q97_36005 [Desulfurellales bacterium]
MAKVEMVSVAQAVADPKLAFTNFRKNGDYASDWIAGRLHIIWRDGMRQTFDPRRASVSVRAEAERNGFHQTIIDAGAMGADEGDGTKQGRMAERRRRMTERMEHLASGSDSWEKPRLSSGAVAESLVLRALVRVFPDRFTDTEAASKAVDTLAAKRSLDRAGALKVWADSQAIALAIVDIRAEDAKARAGGLSESADDILGEILGE